MARLDTEGLWLQLERYISPLHEALSEEGKKKLADILTFWDDLKEKWAEARKKFWTKYDTVQFLLQLRHAREKKEELIKENHQKLEEIWFFTRWKKKQEKFIAEYLTEISRYGEIVEGNKQEYESITLEEVQKSGFREWVALYLGSNNIWDEWAKALAQMELKEWVFLSLDSNQIWAEWAKAISKMELKEWVTLNLSSNNIWSEWAKALSKMELKEWVALDLWNNRIWDEWAKAISEMELKEWVTLKLSKNSIWAEWAEALSKMELKERVLLNLSSNKIWDDWAEALAKNLKLRSWVTLDLSENDIRAEWAEAISKMELKEWVRLDLRWNNIWDESRSTLENWVADAKARGINCEVLF